MREPTGKPVLPESASRLVRLKPESKLEEVSSAEDRGGPCSLVNGECVESQLGPGTGDRGRPLRAGAAPAAQLKTQAGGGQVPEARGWQQRARLCLR